MNTTDDKPGFAGAMIFLLALTIEIVVTAAAFGVAVWLMGSAGCIQGRAS